MHSPVSPVLCIYIYVHVNERHRRKEERSKQGHTNYEVNFKQHNTYIFMREVCGCAIIV